LHREHRDASVREVNYHRPRYSMPCKSGPLYSSTLGMHSKRAEIANPSSAFVGPCDGWDGHGVLRGTRYTPHGSKKRGEGSFLSAPLVERSQPLSGERQGMVRSASTKSKNSASLRDLKTPAS
jgi:hypothetical protein